MAKEEEEYSNPHKGQRKNKYRYVPLKLGVGPAAVCRQARPPAHAQSLQRRQREAQAATFRFWIRPGVAVESVVVVVDSPTEAAVERGDSRRCRGSRHVRLRTRLLIFYPGVFFFLPWLRIVPHAGGILRLRFHSTSPPGQEWSPRANNDLEKNA